MTTLNWNQQLNGSSPLHTGNSSSKKAQMSCTLGIQDKQRESWVERRHLMTRNWAEMTYHCWVLHGQTHYIVLELLHYLARSNLHWGIIYLICEERILSRGSKWGAVKWFLCPVLDKKNQAWIDLFALVMNEWKKKQNKHKAKYATKIQYETNGTILSTKKRVKIERSRFTIKTWRNSKTASCSVLSTKFRKCHPFFMNLRKGKMGRKGNRLNWKGTERQPEIKMAVGWFKKGMWGNQRSNNRIKIWILCSQALCVPNGINEVENALKTCLHNINKKGKEI